MVAFTHNRIDDSPLVQPRRPIVRAEDRDGDGRTDTFAYDLNHDGTADVEHFIADRRTLVTVQRATPWQPPPSLTEFTGQPGDVPLRVVFRVLRIADLVFELNGAPVCLPEQGMCSLGLAWDADREHRDEVEAARHFWLGNGGIGGFERL